MQQKFWTTLGSLYTVLLLIVGTLSFATSDHVLCKAFCLFNIPSILYVMFQFVVNYVDLTETKNEKE
jgi:hypothetical protein